MIEVLRAPSRPRLLVVPNAALMHDHQRELATQFASEGLVAIADPTYVIKLTPGHWRTVYQLLCSLLQRRCPRRT